MSAGVTWAWTLPAAPAIIAAAGVYVLARVRLHAGGVRWPLARDAAFTAGLACIITALVSPVAANDERFPIHIVQHLLLATAAPTALACAAPMTLVLRTAPPRLRRALLALLHARIVRAASCAPISAVLSVATLYALYLTPLYALTVRREIAHAALHAHMLVAGCLLAWALIGTDAVPGRGGWRLRCITLALVMAAHDILAKLMYAHAVPLAARQGVPLADWLLGAKVLWYGGDAGGIVTAGIFFRQWYARRARRHHDESATFTVEARKISSIASASALSNSASLIE